MRWAVRGDSSAPARRPCSATPCCFGRLRPSLSLSGLLTYCLPDCRTTDAAAVERCLCRAGRDVDGRLVHAPQRTVGRDRSGEHSPNGVLPILLPLVLCAGSTGPEPRPGPHLRRWANQAFVLHGTPARHHCALGHSRVLTLVPSLCLLITSRPAVRLLARTTLEATLYSRASAR